MPGQSHLWDLGGPLSVASLQIELSDSIRCTASPWSALSMLCDGQCVLPEPLCIRISASHERLLHRSQASGSYKH